MVERYFKHKTKFNDARYVRRDENGVYTLVNAMGKEGPSPFADHHVEKWLQDGWWIEISQCEALSMLDAKPHDAVEWDDTPDASQEVDVW